MTSRIYELPLELELENREAIQFLAKKGLTPRQIKYLKWQEINKGERTIKINRGENRGRFRRYRVIKYADTPFEPIANREPVSKIYAFPCARPTKTQRKPTGLLPPGCFYDEAIISKIAGENLVANSPFNRYKNIELLGGRISITFNK